MTLLRQIRSKEKSVGEQYRKDSPLFYKKEGGTQIYHTLVSQVTLSPFQIPALRQMMSQAMVSILKTWRRGLQESCTDQVPESYHWLVSKAWICLPAGYLLCEIIECICCLRHFIMLFAVNGIPYWESIMQSKNQFKLEFWAYSFRIPMTIIRKSLLLSRYLHAVCEMVWHLNIFLRNSNLSVHWND